MTGDRDRIIETLTPWEVVRYVELGGSMAPHRLMAARSSLAPKPQPDPAPNPFVAMFATKVRNVTRAGAGIAVDTVKGRRSQPTRRPAMPALPEPVPGEGAKLCSKCGRKKRLSLFHRDRNRPDGRMNVCVVCCFHIRNRTASPEWQAA